MFADFFLLRCRRLAYVKKIKFLDGSEGRSNEKKFSRWFGGSFQREKKFPDGSEGRSNEKIKFPDGSEGRSNEKKNFSMV